MIESQEKIGELAAARAELIDAATSSDPTRLAAVYCLNALLMNPSAPDVHGRQAIEEHFRQAFAAITIRRMTLSPVEVTVCGDHIYELSVSTQLIERTGEAAAEDRGRVMLPWVREPDGRWRIRHALVNSSLAKSPFTDSASAV